MFCRVLSRMANVPTNVPPARLCSVVSLHKQPTSFRFSGYEEAIYTAIDFLYKSVVK